VAAEQDAGPYFGPETLSDFLAAENRCLEQFCAFFLACTQLAEPQEEDDNFLYLKPKITITLW